MWTKLEENIKRIFSQNRTERKKSILFLWSDFIKEICKYKYLIAWINYLTVQHRNRKQNVNPYFIF